MTIRRIATSLLAAAIAACGSASPEPAGPSYQWLSPAHTAELGARITSAGPTARLEVREDTSGMHFRVVTPGARTATVADVNDSHRCPPQCQ